MYIDAAYCCQSSSVVYLSVSHSSEPCKNGWTNQDAIWDEDSGGPRNHVLDGGPDPPRKGASWGKGRPIVKYNVPQKSSTF